MRGAGLVLLRGVLGGLTVISLFALIAQPTPFWAPLVFLVTAPGLFLAERAYDQTFPDGGQVRARLLGALVALAVSAAIVGLAWLVDLRAEGG